MREDDGWQPRSLPSPLEQARLDRRDARSGEMRFRNHSNMFWGYVAAWGLFAMAAALLNTSILTDVDPMTPAEVGAYGTGLWLASMAALCTLGRPYVTLRDEILTIRNPLRKYQCDVAEVQSLTSGFGGFPKLTVAGVTIRVMGMEESLLDRNRGGSDDMAVLRAEIADREPGREGPQRRGLRARSALMDRGLVMLLAAWTAYLASFFAS